MKLTLDIGNTQIKIGVFNQMNLVYSSYFNDAGNITNEFKKIKNLKPKTGIISSVVPSLTLNKYCLPSLSAKLPVSFIYPPSVVLVTLTVDVVLFSLSVIDKVGEVASALDINFKN